MPDFVLLTLGFASALLRSSAKKKMVVLLVFYSVFKVGVAFHPGPVDAFCDANFVLDAANSLCLQSDAGDVLANMSRGELWAMRETHLGSWELQSFTSGLRFVQSSFCETCRLANFDVMSQYCRPQSHMICLHASCLALPFYGRLENADRGGFQLGAVPFRRQARNLDHLQVPV